MSPRLYGEKFLKNSTQRLIQASIETRDAILWDVLPEQRRARVKIQGSSTLNVVYYPENWEQTPAWLKPGNAVKIMHTGGNRGRLEVVGHGMLFPTAVSGASSPAPPTPGDAILSGMEISEATPPGMTASVAPGTYRIDGVTYSLVTLLMDRTDIVMDRTDLVLDEVSAVVAFDAASATHFRYDAIVAGTDGLAHVAKGTNFPASAPGSIPATPADHVRIGWVLIYPNMTQVRQTDINRLFSAPIASELRIVIADDELEWAPSPPPYPSTTLTISIRDQYGNLIPRVGEGYYVTIQWILGNGLLSYGGVNQDESGPLSFYMASSAVVTYTRDNQATDVSPSFYITETATGFAMTATITLLDANGYSMN